MTTNMPDSALLTTMSLDQLRALWREKLKAPPPAHASRDLLARALLYRLSVRRAGQSVRALQTRLTQLAERFAADRDYTLPAAPRMRPGSIIVRDWNGKRYAVTVTETGYLFDGKPYSSLTAVAFAITGVKWSGPRFFKLKDLVEAKAP